MVATIGAVPGEVKESPEKINVSFRPDPWYSVAMKECPMCGENMRLSTREVADRVPGVSQAQARIAREWICPECDYFEEAETGEG